MDDNRVSTMHELYTLSDTLGDINSLFIRCGNVIG